jgi:hypothetical protein
MMDKTQGQQENFEKTWWVTDLSPQIPLNEFAWCSSNTKCPKKLRGPHVIITVWYTRHEPESNLYVQLAMCCNSDCLTAFLLIHNWKNRYEFVFSDNHLQETGFNKTQEL